MANENRASGDEKEEYLLHAALGAGEGDLRAFEQLVRRHQKRIVADCRSMTRDANSAEDLAQEVFVKAFFGLRSFEMRSSFRHWLQRIKVHHCLNHMKKEAGKRHVSFEETAASVSESVQAPAEAQRDLEAREDREHIAKILGSLPSTLRIPLVMRDMDDLSYEEIAASLGIGLSAVKMRIKRAREAFRQQYQKPAGAAETAAH